MSLSLEVVNAQAPDAASLAAGKSLSNMSRWEQTGFSSRVLWGACKGSGKNPYYTQVDLSDYAVKCSCPSRKIPCKHALALMLLAVDNKIVEGEEPEWVTTWLDKRSSVKVARENKTPVSPEKSLADKQKRLVKRYEKVSQGVQELELWLNDLTGEGLLQCQSRPLSWWSSITKRLTDAQAPRLAELTEELSHIVRAGKNEWLKDATDIIGELGLCVRGWQHKEQLDGTPLESSLLYSMGIPVEEEHVVEGEMLVLTTSITPVGKLLQRRTWVTHKHQTYLIRSYSYQNNLSPEVPPGHKTFLKLSLHHPQALYAKGTWDVATAVPQTRPKGVTLSEGITSYSKLLSSNPWVPAVPLGVEGKLFLSTSWFLQDLEGRVVSVEGDDMQCWGLQAATAGKNTTIYGEWDGRVFRPDFTSNMKETL